ncbi:hypothetical protein [Gordonia paraffinivorans]|uniref:hypothetical protein n=1 Tax=Gordonia paraffinivorans TaxID=175628 RepID=UPI001E3F85DE|nr:hypothetical protein [Gordonia paraffinivorans]MCD2144552.1 hypothetical protein [Gordonia paraffinivorans]
MGAKQKLREQWNRYEAWNAAVADVIYPVCDHATPAYMDLEDDVLQRIASVADEQSADPGKALAAVVQGVTIVESGFSLEKIATRTRKWATKSVEPPPCLAFLALTVVAAEEMGNTDEGLAANAYYARLARLLGLSDGDQRLRRQYMDHVEFFWRRVNRWLENLEGERGLPTAFALNFRYVGLPMSQALVREADRQRFASMFSQYGLSPGMRLAPEEISTYLSEWLTTESSAATANLRRLWKRTDSHDRIASVAAVELANWDGASHEASVASRTRRALLVANLRSGFMDSTLDLAVALRPFDAEMNGQMEVLETSGKWSTIRFSPGTAGLWRTSYTESIDFRSILEGVVRLRHPEDQAGIEYKRFPSQVVPLVYDELQSAYVQAERLQLGVDALILVRNSGGTKNPASPVVEVEQVLNNCARPGFNKAESLEGLPEGWTLFSGVQLFAAPTGTKFNELVPLARNQLTVAGGLRLPSRIRKWSTLSPPEVRATAQEVSSLRVTLCELDTDREIGSWTTSTGTLVVPLSTLSLDDGDYQVSLFTGSNKVTQQISIRLRSAESVDEVGWNRAPRLTYSLDTPLGVLSASEEAAENIVVDGLACDGNTDITSTVHASRSIFWGKPRPAQARTLVSVGTPDPTSCVATGAHRIQLPTAYGGKAPKFIQGECSSCGLVKRYPGWLPKNRPARKRAGPWTDSSTIRIADLPDVETIDVHWDAALDALVHLGGGGIDSLENIARQLEGTALFVDTFVRTLEALGHIAVERDQRARPIRWELSPSCLAQTADGNYRLTGRWSKDSVNQIEELVGSQSLRRTIPTKGPTALVLTEVDESVLESIAELETATVVPESGPRLLQCLPRLSEVAASLHRTDLPGFESAERFDLGSATWMQTGDLGHPGAYRIRRGFESLYIYRDPHDVDNGLAAITSVQLAKHLAANASGRTFAFYVAKSQAVATPRGCELPGLYDRAVVAFSGSLPNSKEITIGPRKRKCLWYSSIDQHNADLLFTLLTT